MKPLLCTSSVVRNLLNVEVGSWPAKAIDPSKPMQCQDRRPIKFKFEDKDAPGLESWMSAALRQSPHKVGDVLYVREAFSDHPVHIGTTIFKADYPESPKVQIWRPSIHMPRELSRIHLEVMRVRVERACDISNEDAAAEGMTGVPEMQQEYHGTTGVYLGEHEVDRDFICEFKGLWESLYGTDAWEKWVWAYDLKRIK
jgi:hypothetical protein